MKLATIRLDGRHAAFRIDGDEAVEVGAGRDPKVFLEPGQTVRTSVEGLGECVNRCGKDAG